MCDLRTGLYCNALTGLDIGFGAQLQGRWEKWHWETVTIWGHYYERHSTLRSVKFSILMVVHDHLGCSLFPVKSMHSLSSSRVYMYSKLRLHTMFSELLLRTGYSHGQAYIDLSSFSKFHTKNERQVMQNACPVLLVLCYFPVLHRWQVSRVIMETENKHR